MTLDEIKKTLVLMNLERNKINGINIFIGKSEKETCLAFYTETSDKNYLIVDVQLSMLASLSEEEFKKLIRALATRMIYNSWNEEKKGIKG